ncbi:hypothetical protein DPMN_115322 [Dreissena polymorpha]|uniref:Uncharacterized protein n=1 Tax=Dreissena polymorpha TaxID=45954 RepID=A0A9D4KML6_DREPO|nr:hypothetical protein DPMN_115322 [Dreissena polymorpha]
MEWGPPNPSFADGGHPLPHLPPSPIRHAATEVAVLRRKYKINPPTMDGQSDFLRAVRAFRIPTVCPPAFVAGYRSFFAATDTNLPEGVLNFQTPTAVLGMVYLYTRQRYIKGYIEAAEKRVPPFWLSIRALQGLSVLSIAGLINAVLREYAGVNLVAMARERIF